MSSSNRSYVSWKHTKILGVFYGKGKGPHKNPYANPCSENLKHLPAHLLPETDLKKQFSENTFSQREIPMEFFGSRDHSHQIRVKIPCRTHISKPPQELYVAKIEKTNFQPKDSIGIFSLRKCLLIKLFSKSVSCKRCAGRCFKFSEEGFAYGFL